MKIPETIDWLKIVQSDSAIKSAHSRKSFADILSKPVDFDLHNLDKSTRTLGTLVGFSSKSAVTSLS